MEWTDDGIVLGTRRHGETSAILEVMTREHGRHLGLVRGGAARGCARCCSPATPCAWSGARGSTSISGITRSSRCVCMAPRSLVAAHVVYGVTHLAALCRLLPERDPHPQVHDHLAAMLEHLDDPLTAGLRDGALRVADAGRARLRARSRKLRRDRRENDLVYVSPKSGRAVSRGAGAPWQDRLLRLPAFLSEAVTPSLDDIADGFALTGYFLARHVLEPRGLAFADAREGFVARSWGDQSRGGGLPRAWRSNWAVRSAGSGLSAAWQRLFLVAHLPAPQLAAFLANAVRRHRLLRRPRHLRAVRRSRSIRGIGPLTDRCRVTAGAVGNGKEGSEACHHNQATHFRTPSPWGLSQDALEAPH